MDPKNKVLLKTLVAALACKCPRCGKGPLFSGFLTVAPACTVCGLELARHDSGDGPAVFLIFILGALIVPLVVLVDSVLRLPMWGTMLLWTPVVLGVTLGLLRPAKSLVLALQFHNRRSDFGS
jgi:uncharacterized protein (DUF983 family)